MVTYYRSDATLMDFDVYQFSKEGYPDTLADFVTEEAAEYNGTDIATDVEIKEGVNRTKTVKDRPRRAYLKRVENGTQAVYEARRKAKRKAG